MLVYLVNQMDRFVLGIAAQQTAQSLEYGDQSCLQAKTGKSDVNCKDVKKKRNCTNDGCNWDYDGQGIEYQVLAGPVFVVVFSIAVVVMGIVTEVKQVNRPKVLAVFTTFWSIATFLMGFTTKYWQLVVLRMSLGVFQSVCTPVCASIILDQFEKGIRGSAMSFFNWGVYLGFSLAFVLKYLALNSGWRWAFRVAGMPGIILAIFVFFTIKESERTYQSQRLLSSKISELCYVLKTFLSPSLILLCIAGGIRNGAGLVFAYNVDSFFTQYRHANAAQYMSWIPLVGGTLGSLLGGVMSDRGERAYGLVGRLAVLVFSQVVLSVQAMAIDSFPDMVMSALVV
jgi:MFS family permease